MSVGAKGIGSFGFKTADNSLVCDSIGNCMLKDELLVGPQWTHGLTDDLATANKDNFGMNFGAGGMNFGFKTDDNSLTCDSAGNCMLKDELLYGATSSTWTPKMADNSLTCDA